MKRCGELPTTRMRVTLHSTRSALFYADSCCAFVSLRAMRAFNISLTEDGRRTRSHRSDTPRAALRPPQINKVNTVVHDTPEMGLQADSKRITLCKSTLFPKHEQLCERLNITPCSFVVTTISAARQACVPA